MMMPAAVAAMRWNSALKQKKKKNRNALFGYLIHRKIVLPDNSNGFITVLMTSNKLQLQLCSCQLQSKV
jgi:hypothetical protein